MTSHVRTSTRRAALSYPCFLVCVLLGSAGLVEAQSRDLQVTAVSNPPATANAGTSFTVTDTTANTGSGTAAASMTRYRLSPDATITSADPLLTGGRSIPTLAAGASSTGTVTVVIPTSLASGTYFLGACADDTAVVAESNEANNCRTSATTIQVTKADLVVSTLSNPPAAAAPGTTFTVTDTTANTGTGAAAASTTRYRLSLDATISGTDSLLTGTRSVPGLAAGASSTDTITVFIPTTFALGTYFLGACADDTATVPESNETNNCRPSTSTVHVTRPDLAVSALSDPPAAASPGSSFSVTETTTNTGAVAAGASTTRYKLSLDATVTSTDPLLTGTRSVPSLVAGATSTGAVTVTVPTNLALGTYFLAACADDLKIVTETNEANNCHASATTVQITQPPNLIVSALSEPPASASVGGNFAVTDTTTNSGTGPAAASTTRYRLSLDAIIASTDPLLTGTRSVPSLAAGASSTGTLTVTIPTTLALGAYFLGACADDLKVVGESNEANNCRASTTKVTVTGTPSISSLSPASGPIGTSVTIAGANFGASQGVSRVTFNGVLAPPTSWSTTAITVAVPAGATTGSVVVTVAGVASNAITFTVTATSVTYIYDGLGRLRAAVSEGTDTAIYAYDAAGNLLSISLQPSTVLAIIEFEPRSGPAGTVTVFGTGFSSTATVTFNGLAAPLISATSTRIVTGVPPGATTGPITVTTSTGTATSSTPFTVTGPMGTPTITGFTPAIGPAGTGVTVTGTNFDTNPALDKLSFNTTQAAISSVTPTTITTHVPSGAASGPITITTPLGKAVSTDVFVTADVAVPITVNGAPVTVTLGEPRQTARLAFDGTTGQHVSLGIVNVTIPGSDVSLSRVDGSPLGLPKFVGVSGNTIDASPLPITGRYVILVDPRDNNTGSMTLWLSEDLASVITIGGSATVTTSRPGQNARLAVSGAAGQQVSVQIATGAVASDVSILNPDGTTLASPTFAGASGGFIDQKTLPAAGTYTILVDPRSTNTGSLTLSLLDATDVTGSIAIGGSATVTTTRLGQNARLMFSGAAGQQVSLQIATGAVASDVSILNPDGTTLASPSFAGASGGFIDQETLPSTGTYTILVDPRSTNTGSLTLTLLDATDITGSIAIGGSATVTTTRPGQNARLTVSGTPGQQVSLQIATGAVASDVSILNPDGTALAPPSFVGASGSFIDQKTLAAAGTYTILVDPRSTNTGSLTLTLFDATDATGTVTIGGATVTVSIAQPGQNARLTLSGAAGQQVTVRLTANAIGTTTVRLLGTDGTTLTSATSGLASFTLATQTLPATGTYTISIDPGGTRTGSMNVSVTSP